MKEKTQFKLVILYDNRENQYMICDHNLTPEMASEEADMYKNQNLSVFTINQRGRHRAADAQACQACRNEVERSSGLAPTPQFKRREP